MFRACQNSSFACSLLQPQSSMVQLRKIDAFVHCNKAVQLQQLPCGGLESDMWVHRHPVPRHPCMPSSTGNMWVHVRSFDVSRSLAFDVQARPSVGAARHAADNARVAVETDLVLMLLQLHQYALAGRRQHGCLAQDQGHLLYSTW